MNSLPNKANTTSLITLEQFDQRLLCLHILLYKWKTESRASIRSKEPALNSKPLRIKDIWIYLDSFAENISNSLTVLNLGN